MAIVLYYTPESVPCRLVMLTAAALGIPLVLKHINLVTKEQFNKEYMKLNPQHTVPTMIDAGFVLRESRAISRYLLAKYGKGNKWDLYPEDTKQRALIDQLLDFDIGTLYPRFADYFYPQIFAGIAAKPNLLKKLHEGLKLLDNFLEGQHFLALDRLTLADLALVVSISTMVASGISLDGYLNIIRWCKVIKQIAPAYETVSSEGLKSLQYIADQITVKSKL